MQTVSTEYTTQIKQNIRNPSYIKILFKITDPDAVDDSITSDNSSMYWSDSSNITSGLDVTEHYSTLEHNITILDEASRLPIPTGETQIYQGYVGNEISDSDGYWATNPTISVNFSTTYFQFAGLALKFDSIRGDFPKQFNIKVYKDDVLVQTISCTPTNYDFGIEDAIVECNRIDFEAVQSSIPYRRFRIDELFLGIKRYFTETNVEKTSFKHTIDLINSKLPIYEFDFSVIDKEREYDPESTTGLYSYIDAKQECSAEIGYELNDGTIEWVSLSNSFTDGEATVNASATIPIISFKTKSALSFLIDDYNKGLYYPAGRTLYQLAEDVLLDSSIPLDDSGNNRWYIDTILQNYTTTVPLDKNNKNILLQQIANAGRCVLDIDRNGYITISQKNDTLQDFTFNLKDMEASPPEISKYPVLQGVDTSYNTVSVSSTTEEIGTYDIIDASSTIYSFNYDMATDISSTAGTGLSIEGTPVFYAQTCYITLNGTGKLIISGKKITINETSVSLEVNSTGERCPITNSLINTYSMAIDYAVWVSNYIQRRSEYSFKDRGFPELDTGDSIGLDTLYTDDIEADIISSTISFNGTISGNTTVLKK